MTTNLVGFARTPCAALSTLLLLALAATAAGPGAAAAPPPAAAPLPAAVAPAGSAVHARAGGDRPRVANPREVAEQLTRAALAARVTADGTVFASVEIRPDGSVATREFYGTLANDPRFGPVVRAATSALRFEVPSGWRAAHPDGRWAAFWMFQTNGCEPDVYVAPADVTTIRACMVVEGGRVVLSASDVRFDAAAGAAAGAPRPTIVESQPLPYPSAARKAGSEGVTIVRVTLDERGRVATTEYVAEPSDPAFRPAVARWLVTTRFAAPPGWGSRPAYVRIAFALTRADDCVWTLDRFEGEDVRICGGR